MRPGTAGILQTVLMFHREALNGKISVCNAVRTTSKGFGMMLSDQSLTAGSYLSQRALPFAGMNW
jgi:hypothetical protein